MKLVRARAVTAYVVLVGVAVVLVGKAAMPLDNLDTYFHLRFGHEFLTGAWSLRDPGSVTRFATADWVPTQWLPQIVMAQLEEWFGLSAVAWLAGLLFLTLALSIYVACRRQAEPLVAAIVVALTLEACTSGMSMRPQQISYILVVVTTAAWLRARETGRVPWWLVPVAWVWTMCHGMWPIGIVIGLVAVAGLGLDREHPRRVLLRMLAVPVLSALVSLLTPVGPGLFEAVLRVSSRAKYFYEWGPPDFTELPKVTLLVLLALAIVPRMRRGKTPWFDLLLIGLAALWAVYSMRTVPVAACLVAPLAAAGVQAVLTDRTGADRPPARRRERIGVAAGYALALATLALVVPHTADEPLATPAWMDDALGDLPAGTAVVDETAFGGYLMWCFPQLDLVIHGYGDTFTDAELERNADLDAARAGWRELLIRTGAEYAVLPPGSPLAYNLRAVEHWEVLESSPDVELLQAPPGWPGS
ncbi:MAG TPA: hypothetical protein DEQ43_14610 [Nocardioides bacterium]|uniref:hypothetical protein n=1 Tax=uncultured Nocardioides sp. TaxID=198441 RepID=UPI000EE40100|nr:hypothetical protein [uncultured Nocardioides sp.]HCB05452.1 hypothetical protein [Nocardioides sp.]